MSNLNKKNVIDYQKSFFFFFLDIKILDIDYKLQVFETLKINFRIFSGYFLILNFS